MQAVSNTGRSGVLVLKVDEDDVNTVLMNTDIENDGSLKYAYDNFADAFSEKSVLFERNKMSNLLLLLQMPRANRQNKKPLALFRRQ